MGVRLASPELGQTRESSTCACFYGLIWPRTTCAERNSTTSYADRGTVAERMAPLDPEPCGPRNLPGRIVQLLLEGSYTAIFLRQPIQQAVEKNLVEKLRHRARAANTAWVVGKVSKECGGNYTTESRRSGLCIDRVFGRRSLEGRVKG